MSHIRHLGFGSTPNFPNLYKVIKRHFQSLAITPEERAYIETLEGEQIEEFFANRRQILPTLTFTGSEKLHGENMAVCYCDGTMWVQGRNRINTVEKDQNGMAQFVELHKQAFLDIFDDLASPEDTIVLDGEWAGGNIQKGNAACSGTEKAFYMFDYFRVIDKTGDECLYTTKHLADPSENIFVMTDFAEYSVTLDFNKPKECEDTLKDLALAIEENSP